MIYTVTLIEPTTEKRTTLSVGEDEYLNDAAMEQGIELPTSCSAGACITCAAKIVKGEVYQDQNYLKAHEEAAGFILTCRTFPRSNCEILIHQEMELLTL
jgi:ferredoxin